MEVKKLVVFGLGQRGGIYAAYTQKNPQKMQLVAIIEIDEKKIERAKRQYPNVPIFTDAEDFLAAKIPADIVAVATQDNQHREHAIQMMKAGYDLLLEKPIANNREDCMAIYEASLTYKRRVIVCHVLRYTPFYSTVKDMIDEGKLGEIVTIQASENVGFYHQAHSFVRGPWRNSVESSPMILAKCCHDMDILRYLMGEPCISLSSMGGLYYFKKKNAPRGAAKYCSDCRHADCIYKAQTLYTAPKSSWCSAYFTTKELTEENILTDLKHTQYDRCVFACDNDVVDHQVTIMQFASGKTVGHTMTAFSSEIYRQIKIHGTKAELIGSPEKDEIEIRYFGGNTECIHIQASKVSVGGHSGGDHYMMENLCKVLNGQEAKGVTYLAVSLESHLMAFAAEESRLQGGMPQNIQE